MKQYIIDFFKYGFLNLALFWCPWGRISRRSFAHFYWFYTLLLLFLFCLIFKKYNRFSWYWLYLLIPLESAAIRRGHDLGYSAWYTVFHFIRGTTYTGRLLREEGDIGYNQYGSSPSLDE